MDNEKEQARQGRTEEHKEKYDKDGSKKNSIRR